MKFDWSDLEELYIKQKLSTLQIAEFKGCSNTRVSQRLRGLGISARSMSDALHLAYDAGRKSRRGSRPRLDISDLEELYTVRKLSDRQIAELKGVSRNAVRLRRRRLGIPSRSYSESLKLATAKGAKSKSWKGGRICVGRGYIIIYRPEHPHAKKGYVLEHRLVVEKKLGRYLRPWEVVHHQNGIKDDNRPENLELFPSDAQHMPSKRWEQELRKRDRRIDELEGRVTLLEAENVVLRQGVGVERHNE